MGQKIILLLDANPTIQKVVDLAFADSAYQIISLNIDLPTLEDTLEKIRNISPHMVLLDFDLPGIRGKDICKKIKEDPSLANLPVVLLVRELDKYSLEKLQEYGADRVLGKPFDTADLVKVVEELFNPGQRMNVLGQKQLGMMPDLERWLRKIVEEKVEEILLRHLEEIVTDKMEQFLRSEDFLRHFQEAFMGSEHEICQYIKNNSQAIIETMAMKVVAEQARVMIQREIDRLKQGG